MKSYFVTGTDTSVGKTIITAGLARIVSNLQIDVGVMKPFLAGEEQGSTNDTNFLANAARVSDSEDLLTPEVFSIPASPYTGWKKLGVKGNVSKVIDSFKTLSEKHDLMLVEGIGGIMTPLLKDYFLINLIKEMKLDVIIIITNKLGTVNHSIMTVKMCELYHIPISGIIINNLDSEGYVSSELKNDIQELTSQKVLGIVPRLDDLTIENISKVIEKEIDYKSLL